MIALLSWDSFPSIFQDPKVETHFCFREAKSLYYSFLWSGLGAWEFLNLLMYQVLGFPVWLAFFVWAIGCCLICFCLFLITLVYLMLFTKWNLGWSSTSQPHTWVLKCIKRNMFWDWCSYRMFVLPKFSNGLLVLLWDDWKRQLARKPYALN